VSHTRAARVETIAPRVDRYTDPTVSFREPVSAARDSGPAPRPAELVRTISSGGGIAVRTLVGSNLIADAMALRPIAPTAANALARAMMGAVLIAVAGADREGDEDGESVQIQLRGDGPLGSVLAISDARGRVRGTVANPSADLALSDGTPDVARSVGMGTLTVVRHRPGWREPYTGTVPLISGEIAQDITLYLTESEQTPSAMGLGVAMANDESAVVAGGFLVQQLPGATAEEVDRVEANIRALPRLSDAMLVGTTCEDLIDQLLDGIGARALHREAPIFYCPCTRARALRTLALLGPDELAQMISGGVDQDVRCQFCARAYVFSPEDFASLLPTA
jgi:molecular chaperone Hsp33